MKSRFATCALLASTCIPLAGQLALAQGTTGAPSVEQLQIQLERRDAIISDLLQRVQALEQRVGAPAPSALPPRPSAAAPAVAPRARTATEEAAEDALLERALERSLVLSGGALLSHGQRELEPSLSYDFSQRSGIAALGAGVVSRNFRRENVTAGLALRAGLPWSSQVDVAIPFTHQRIESVVEGIARNSSDSGIGDIQAALTHQFVNDRDGRLAVLGSVGWVHSRDSASLRPLAAGLPDFVAPAAIGSGHDAWVARITASKRLDPLVFVASASHAWNRADSVGGVSVKGGDADGLNLRAILAASPDVSLRSGFSFTRAGKARIGGLALEGTRTTASILELGASVVLNRSMLLDLSFGIGLTAESPDFLLGVSLPIRF